MKKSQQIFSNLLLERISQTSLRCVLIFYIGLFLLIFFKALQIHFLYLLPLFCLGVLSWTLTEYLIHRFVFHHYIFQTYFRSIYLIMHGIHHDNTLDKYRLLVPIYVSFPIGAIIYVGLNYYLGCYADAFFSGFILGYLGYDIIHYRIHNFPSQTAIGKKLKTYHFSHHFKNPENNFGVSSPLWDYFFRTKQA